MSDIIVTIPRDYDMTSKMASLSAYWRVRRWPKETEPGERIYFVQHGEVRYRATISEDQHGDCEIDFEDLKELSEPWEKMGGFRGYRYYKPSQPQSAPNNKEETRK